MFFRKRYTEEEVENIVNNALEEQKAKIERENEMAYVQDKLEELDGRLSALENKKAGF